MRFTDLVPAAGGSARRWQQRPYGPDRRSESPKNLRFFGGPDAMDFARMNRSKSSAGLPAGWCCGVLTDPVPAAGGSVQRWQQRPYGPDRRSESPKNLRFFGGPDAMDFARMNRSKSSAGLPAGWCCGVLTWPVPAAGGSVQRWRQRPYGPDRRSTTDSARCRR